MSDNVPNYALNAIFGVNHPLSVVLQQVERIQNGSVGSITVEDAKRFIENHDPEDRLSELIHLIDVLHRAAGCFRAVIVALDNCLGSLYHLSQRFHDLSDLFTDYDEETGQEIHGAGDPLIVAETMVRTLRRSLFFARI